MWLYLCLRCLGGRALLPVYGFVPYCLCMGFTFSSWLYVLTACVPVLWSPLCLSGRIVQPGTKPEVFALDASPDLVLIFLIKWMVDSFTPWCHLNLAVYIPLAISSNTCTYSNTDITVLFFLSFGSQSAWKSWFPGINKTWRQQLVQKTLKSTVEVHSVSE